MSGRLLTWLAVALIGPPLAACEREGSNAVEVAANETPSAKAGEGAEPDPHTGHESAGVPPASESAAAYDAAMARMHDDMGRASDDPDETFMRMMIPHHQGAIDMAEIVLEHGDDPEARAMAEAVIEAQRREIGEMEDWRARREATAANDQP
ncbi:MAG: DUF305 domain-containing protein [Sphingomonadaceae bacterium]|nr:DUF305 domain-containing protein [Sphingomonadaceae bacterium]